MFWFTNKYTLGIPVTQLYPPFNSLFWYIAGTQLIFETVGQWKHNKNLTVGILTVIGFFGFLLCFVLLLADSV